MTADDPPTNVPAVTVILPVNVCVNVVPKLTVPPVPFIVKSFTLKLLKNLAVPPVLVTLILPVVVNPAIV